MQRKMRSFFSPPRHKPRRPKNRKSKLSVSDAARVGRPKKQPVIDLAPKQTLLSPLYATSKVKVKAKHSATRASYAVHTVNGKR